MGTDHRLPARLALQALDAAIRGDAEQAARIVARIAAQCGRDGLELAARTWCDAYREHATGGKPGRIELSFVQADTGQVTTAGLPADVAWAGTAIAAAGRCDDDAFAAAAAQLPDDAGERAPYIGRLLEAVATAITTAPAGYALGERAAVAFVD